MLDRSKLSPVCSSFVNDEVRSRGLGHIHILRRAEQLTPLTMEHDGKLYELLPPPTKDRESRLNMLVGSDMYSFDRSVKPFKFEWVIEVYLTIITYHLRTSSFSPTVAEVLAQIPPEIMVGDLQVHKDIVGFRTIHQFPQPLRTMRPEEVPSYRCTREATYFWARTEIYRRIGGQ
jgi:hypothetical protein